MASKRGRLHIVLGIQPRENPGTPGIPVQCAQNSQASLGGDHFAQSTIVLPLSLPTRIAESRGHDIVEYGEGSIPAEIKLGLVNRSLDKNVLLRTLLTRFIFILLSSNLQRPSRRVRPDLQAAVKLHYDDVILSAKLGMDLPTLQADNISRDRVTSTLPWETVESIASLLASSIALSCQLVSIVALGWIGYHRFIFVGLCLVRPLLKATEDTLWGVPRIIETTDNNFLRMNVLTSLTNKEYRHDILSGNMVQYIISQFRKARRALGNTPVEEAEELYEDRNKSMFRHTLQSLSFELPSVINQDFASLKVLISPQLYCTAAVLLQSSTPLTLTIITTLNQSSTIISWSSWDISDELKKMRRNIGLLQELDVMRNAKSVVQDGTTPYPNESTKNRLGWRLS
ncbi:hypothetical protein V5O48_007900 [Marasmius crinis-equi]|uniref:Uncharacterized protein n=1 Tax=Marasmius crinis-equi TaxID=585013 RepID=A0ABR3FFD2_9AGAR